MVFPSTEIRSAYFLPGEDLTISSDLTFTKADLSTEVRNVTGTINGTVAKDHYLVTIDYSLENGRISPLLIVVDESTNDIPITIDEVVTFETSLGGSSSDFASDIKLTSDDGYILAGYSNSVNGDVTGNHGSNDYWVVKLDSSGSLIWQKSFGGTSTDIARSVQLTADGGYIVAGQSQSNDGDVTGNHGGADAWVIKLDASGNLLWQKSFGGTSYDEARYIQLTNDGGYILAAISTSTDGDVTGNHGDQDYWVIKLDASGNLLWQKSLGGTSIDQAYSVDLASDGGYIVAGTSSSVDGDVSENHGFSDYWVVKLDASANLVWQKSLGGTLTDNANSIKPTTDGGYVVAGSSNSSDGDVTGNHGNWDYWVVNIGTGGNLVWQKSLGGSNTDEPSSVQPTNDGGYVVAGTSRSVDDDVSGNQGIHDYWIVKLDADGNL